MSIESDFKQIKKPGLQGGVSFDASSVVMPLYKKIESFFKGSLGFQGTGGERANKPNIPNGYQEAHAFNSLKTRNAVMNRMENQLTDFLEAEFGEIAKASGKSIPDFLQSQGIRGISETGTGKNKRLTAFKKENFVEATWNPITGSNNRSVNAYLKQIGTPVSSFGGTSENRRSRALLRPREAEEVLSRTEQTKNEVIAGVHNKSGLEGYYISAADKIEVKRARDAIQDNVQAHDISQRSPGARMAIESRILAQHERQKAYKEEEYRLKDKGLISGGAERGVELPPRDEAEVMREKILKAFRAKQLKAVVTQNMIDNNELPDGQKQKKEPVSSFAAAGMFSLVSRIWSILGTIKSLTGTMVSLLTKLSAEMGKMIMDSAELGIDPQEAARWRKWGIANPTYTQGNESLMFDAAKEVNQKFGDLINFSANGGNFDTAALHGYSKVIGLSVEGAVDKDPVSLLKKTLGLMASTYAGIEGKDAKARELKTQNLVLNKTFGGSSAALYTALIKDLEGSGALNKKNASNIVDFATSSDRVDRLKTTGTHLDYFTRMSNGAIDVEQNTQVLNGLLGDFGKIQNALFMMLLSNMDLIVSLLLGLLRAALNIYDALPWSGDAPKQALKELDKVESQMAIAGYENNLVTGEKFKLLAENKIEAYLSKKGLTGNSLTEEKKDIVSRIASGRDMKDEHKKWAQTKDGAEAIAGVVLYEKSKRKADELHGDRNSRFHTFGNGYGSLFENGGAVTDALLRYGNKNHLQASFVQNMDSLSLGEATINKIKGNVTGSSDHETRVTDPTALKTLGRDILSLVPYVDDYDRKNPRGIFDVTDPKMIRSDADENEKAKTFTDEIFKTYIPFRKNKKEKNFDLKKDLSVIPLNSYDYYGSLSEKASAAGVSGSGATGNEPFEVINHIKLTINGKEVMTNIENLSDDSRRLVSRSINAKFAGPMG